MNISKKVLIAAGVIVSVLIIGVSVVIAVNISTPEESGQPQQAESSSLAPETDQDEPDKLAAAQANYSYKNIDGLYFIPSTMYDEFKAAVDQYMERTERTDISEIAIQDKIVTEDDILYTFWLRLNDDTILRGAYNYDLNRYAFEVETDEETLSYFLDNLKPDGIDNPDVSYTYVELSIKNLEELKSVLPDAACQRFPDELLDFLASQNELRRLFTISGITQAGDSVSWTCSFDTLRIDRKNISVTYSADTDSFTFSLD